MRLYLDIETNTEHWYIWCCCVLYNGQPMTYVKGNEAELQRVIDQADEVVAHNGIGFDFPVLQRVWNVTVPREKQRDTLIISRLLNPNLPGGHSLKAWGERLGKVEKIEFSDFDGGFTAEMEEYCHRDVELLQLVDLDLDKRMKKWKNPAQSIALEHRVAQIIQKQVENGFMLDEPHTVALLGEVQSRMAKIEAELQAVFPPIVTERYSEKTGKRLKDNVEVFNVGSRQQIFKRLTTLGAKFDTFTEKGNAIVDEGTLKNIDLPEAKLCAEYLMLQKRDGMIRSWLEKLGTDGRVHGQVITNGAVTGRMTHSNPNMGQITGVQSEYGKESRQCWTVPEGYKLVGCDLAGIELRCLAHYMKDEDWTKELLEGDIHTTNQKAAGLETRAQAKTMIYATLYGAGAAKIGSIVGGGRNRGKQIMEDFYNNTPALKKLKQKIESIAETYNILPALDGRALQVRSTHSALNTLLQSCGAIIAKQWLVEIDSAMERTGLHEHAKQVAMVHDEVQFECKEQYAQQLGQLLVDCASRAGDTLRFRVPVDAEYAIGDNWFDTH